MKYNVRLEIEIHVYISTYTCTFTDIVGQLYLLFVFMIVVCNCLVLNIYI